MEREFSALYTILMCIFILVKNQIMQYQSFTTGLYPRHSNNEETAFVRDSLYCSMACWSLSLAYA